MTITTTMNRKKFAAAVVRQLEKHGLSCVLVGGACVSIYTDERHASQDLDFISPYSQEAITKSLSEIGFKKKGALLSSCELTILCGVPIGAGRDRRASSGQGRRTP